MLIGMMIVISQHMTGAAAAGRGGRGRERPPSAPGRRYPKSPHVPPSRTHRRSPILQSRWSPDTFVTIDP